MEGPDEAAPTVAVITGGGGGMGRACARRLAGGSSLLLADASERNLAEALAELEADGIEAAGIVCDVADPTAVAALAERAAGPGTLGPLVHIAGLSSTMAEPPRILTVNLTGTALVLDAFLPLAGPGSVALCIASMAGHRSGPEAYDELLLEPRAPDFLSRLEAAVVLDGGKAYDLSKRGVIVQVERRAEAWARRGARILSLSPGLIATPMGDRAVSGRGRHLADLAPLRRLGTADEIAAVVAFVCSPAASYMTGTDLRVDGGVIAAMHHNAAEELARDWNGWGAAGC